ncbi:hypothetical protein L1887_47817 [Cichorium endivia]|nr:hypothetical protein L1887_47817 [Cichorium endivia]
MHAGLPSMDTSTRADELAVLIPGCILLEAARLSLRVGGGSEARRRDEMASKEASDYGGDWRTGRDRVSLIDRSDDRNVADALRLREIWGPFGSAVMHREFTRTRACQRGLLHSTALLRYASIQVLWLTTQRRVAALIGGESHRA